MSASAPPTNPTAHHVQSLIPKFTSQDPDIRFMSLNDLHSILLAGHPTFLSHDYTTCARVIEGFLHTLNDQNGDVQNMAVKCLGPFVNRAPDNILCPMIEKVSNLKTDNSVDNSIPALAVRAIVVALPRPVPGTPRTPKVNEAYGAVSKAVIPRLIGKVIVPISGNKNAPAPPKGMIEGDIETGQDTNALDILIEVARCFGTMLQDSEVKALKQIAMQVLESSRCSSVMKKKAVTALSELSAYFSDALMSAFVSETIEKLRVATLAPEQQKLHLSIYGAMARTIPTKFGPYLKTLAPFVSAPLSQQQLDQQREVEAESDGARDPQVEEVREAALVALDAFCSFCAQDMEAYASDALGSALRFLRYDPNFADDDEDMDADEEDDADDELDEDFEEETGFDDEDDVSWKVRRCSAKLIHTLIDSRTLTNDETLYDKIAPALITRFNEREESVRLEVLAAMTSLVSKVRSSYQSHHIDQEATAMKAGPNTRKRRRGSSNAGFSETQARLATSNGYTSPSTPPPQTTAQHSLANIGPDVIRGTAKLLKSSTAPVKQSALSLLSELITAQRGGLSKDMSLVMDAVIDILKSSSSISSTSSASAQTLRIEALKFLRVVADLHSSKVLQGHLAKVVPVLVSAVKDKYGRVAVEAVETTEVYIKALTPPRSAAALPKTGDYLKQMFDVLSNRITASETDTEVRQSAITALGMLVGRTSGSKGSSLLSSKLRQEGQGIILERLRNELTRLASVKAVEAIALLTQSNKDVESAWVQQVSTELAAQLRKANRSLRGTSLSALRVLAVNSHCRQCYDDQTTSHLVEALLPVLADSDLHMLGPALTTLSAYAKDKPAAALTPAVIAAVCGVTKLDLQGSTLDALLELVETFGKSGQGQGLMSALLKDVGVKGDAEIVGQVIGTLLVSAGGKGVGVTLEQFKQELSTSADEKRKCLALYILGEVGLRLGSSSPLTPKDFSAYFDAESEKVRIAGAVALGRAGAGNVKAYLPVIMSSMQSGRKYLLLHSVKEMLQHGTAEADTLEYSKPLWDMILTASQDSDNRALGAECVGRLAIMDPASYLPKLQEYLTAPQQLVRGMVISAFRYTFTDTDPSFDTHLQPIIVQSLTTMLNEQDLDNRRLALTTFNSAAHNKPSLIRPHLQQLLPLAMKETIIRTELIREVSMGPFKHKVDDGLELRKSAYETLYALMETAFTSLPVSDFYDRVLAGIKDEHEIKIICCLMSTKLTTLAPVETAHSLTRFAEAFRVVLAFRPKDNAVKQELEKVQEHNRAVLKVMILMNKAFAGEAAEGRGWSEAVEWARKEHPVAWKVAEEELREKDR